MGITHRPFELLRSTGNRQVGRQRGTRTSEDLIHPIISLYRLVHVNVLKRAITAFVTGLLITEKGILILRASKIVGILGHKSTLVGHGLHATIQVEIHRNFTFLTALGGHNHNTVGTTGTVNGGGECVL